MRDAAAAEHLLEIYMPRIGTGLDQLKLEVVRAMIYVVFRRSGIRLTMFAFNPATAEAQPRTALPS